MFNSLLQKTKRAFSIVSLPNGSKVHSNSEFVHKDELEMDDNDLKLYIYDLLKVIKDPEKDATLEDLNVIQEYDIYIIRYTTSHLKIIRVEFSPTVPHCNLVTLIGLCIRVKLQRSLRMRNIKVEIFVKAGTHQSENTVNKQINDKERVAAAMENPSLKQVVEACLKEEE